MNPTVILFLIALLFSPFGWATTYVYDSLGRLSTVTYDNGAGIAYAYDAAGNITSLTQNTSTTSVQMASPSLTVDESGSNATLTLSRIGSLAGITSVRWSVSNGTAVTRASPSS